MRVKLDENLPVRLAGELTSLGHDTDTVSQESLGGHPDPDVWRAAQESDRFFITQDLDFSDIRQYRPGSHCGLLLIRLRFPARRLLIERISCLFRTQDVESWRRCLVVVTESKIRVVTPDTRPSPARKDCDE